MKYCIDCLQRKFEDAKVVIRRCKSKNDGQYNDQKKKDKHLSTKYY